MFKTIVANAFLGEFGALTIVSTEGLKTGNYYFYKVVTLVLDWTLMSIKSSIQISSLKLKVLTGIV